MSFLVKPSSILGVCMGPDCGCAMQTCSCETDPRCPKDGIQPAHH